MQQHGSKSGGVWAQVKTHDSHESLFLCYIVRLVFLCKTFVGINFPWILSPLLPSNSGISYMFWRASFWSLCILRLTVTNFSTLRINTSWHLIVFSFLCIWLAYASHSHLSILSWVREHSGQCSTCILHPACGRKCFHFLQAYLVVWFSGQLSHLRVT